jgi:predicted  nucleic acid-binding Zn-ribbon protein
MTTKKKSINRGAKKLEVLAHKKEGKELSSYDVDFYKWTKNQATFLKKGEYLKLDIDHLIEEIESLGRSEKRALESYLANLLLHLLKIEYQPNKHSKSWDLSVKNSRHKIKVLLSENPSLKRHLPKILNEAYFTARLNAISETGLEDEKFPEACPWDLEKIMTE